MMTDVDGRMWSTLSRYCGWVILEFGMLVAKLHFSPVSSLALPVPDCSFYTVATYVRCYAPWYKSVIQLGVGLYTVYTKKNLRPSVVYIP